MISVAMATTTIAAGKVNPELDVIRHGQRLEASPIKIFHDP
jgi:hypothetical protein